MYCTNCGTVVTDGAAFCAKCGSRIEPSAASPASPPTVVSTEKGKTRKPLHGVGGWLGLLVLGMTVLGPFFGGTRLFGDFTAAESKAPQLVSFAPWLSYKTEIWVIFGITALISFCAGILLFRFKPSSVRVAITSLWVAGPIGALADIVAANSAFASDVTSEMSQAMWPSVITAAIAAAIWTAYLLRSKRVKNTYYSDALVP